jgi:hypothetical protein
MTETQFAAMALRAVAADLKKLLYDRPEITARLHGEDNTGEATRFVHAVIAVTVEDLQDRLVTLAADRGIDLRADA